MSKTTRREFTLMCAASLAVPGMLLPSKSKAQHKLEELVLFKDYFELRDEEHQHYLKTPIQPCHTSEKISYYHYESPIHDVIVPQKHAFLVMEGVDDHMGCMESINFGIGFTITPVYFAWGHIKLSRSIYTTNLESICSDVLIVRGLKQGTNLALCENEDKSFEHRGFKLK